MARTLKPATSQTVYDVESALVYLKAARDFLARAECDAAAGKVRRAIKSADGAARHAKRRLGAMIVAGL